VTDRAPVVLIWHDRGQSAVDAAHLMGNSAAHVVSPTWDPGAEDGGRATLLVSVREARELVATNGGDPDELGLVGFGLGAVAAAGLALHAKRLGIGLGRTLCVSPTWDEPDPISGVLLAGPPERVELVENPADAAAWWAAG
jgi:hypothetical protein